MRDGFFQILVIGEISILISIKLLLMMYSKFCVHTHGNSFIERIASLPSSTDTCFKNKKHLRIKGVLSSNCFLAGLSFKTCMLFCIVLFSISNVHGQNSLAIPGALGFGKHVRGAYAGSGSPTILYVDTLAGESVSTGENRSSFRWAMEQGFPRVILFEVSGYINLKNYLRVTSPYLSVYGQTAPGKGITITGSHVDLRTDYDILQHLRFRLNSSANAQEDALTIYSGSNVFIDHCSFSFALDENIGVAGTFTGPLTISNCILSHPIYGEDSKGILMSGSYDSISVIRNAFIHCGQRSPYFKEDSYTTAEVLNNICYNAEYYGIMFDNGNAPKINIIGNQWLPGNNSVNPQSRGAVRIRDSIDLESKFYMKDNLCPGRIEGSEWRGTVKIDINTVDSTQFYQSQPFDYTSTNDIYPASELLTRLDSCAGAFFWDRDPVDSIAIYNMLNGTGYWLEDTTQTFYPSIPELSIALDLPGNPHSDEDGDGFTNLEEWLYGITTTSGTDTSDEINSIRMTGKSKTFTFYPNPAKTVINACSEEEVDVTIYNKEGKLYYQDHIKGSVAIPVGFPEGLYIINVITKEKNKSSYKLLIRK